MTNDIIWDCETYPNVFTIAAEHAHLPIKWYFELSPWRNDSRAIVEWVHWLKDSGARMVGFNSLGFDYPILHTLVRMGQCDAQTLYSKAQSIIESQDGEDGRWLHNVKPSDRLVPQIDLFKIHHFDNKAKATGLKALEFNMRLDNLSDLPFPVGSHLTQDQLPVLRQYNEHDVHATKRFYHHTTPMIRFRDEMVTKYPAQDWLNFNDTKIGKEFFVLELEKHGVQCYEYGPNGRQPKQSVRPFIRLADVILPWINFEQPELRRILDWFKAQTITETKGVFSDITAAVNGFTFVFGLGGIHGSVENEVHVSDDDTAIIDLDVSSYYPNLSIVNGFYPAHLGTSFPVIYKDLYEQRKRYAKNTAENAMLKLALNGTYGDSNNRFSVFYDPAFTMSITLNGQLLLCLLAENLLKVEGLTLIQCNTDGVTVKLPRGSLGVMDQVAAWWEQRTGLQLEQVEYKRMMIADVNSYLAQDVSGKVKRKGRYEWDVEWHQNASALVVAKVAERVLIEGAPIRQTIESWPDKMDFMCRVKVPRSSKLFWGGDQIQNTTRYYVSTGGKPLTKVMPPLKGKTEWRKFAIEAGWQVTVCNNIADATEPVNFDYYVNETEKLCNILN